MTMQTDSRPVVLVTGASGFVGSTLCPDLIAAGYAVRGVKRNIGRVAELPDIAYPVSWVTVPDIGPDTSWEDSLSGVTSVVHLAARVHVMRDKAANPLAAFREVNTAGTERLARAAAWAGVKRFVFLSSIKVSGEETWGTALTELNAPDPQDPYAISKWEAEQSLHRIAAETGMEVVVLRCPLVYGPGVKGNFLRLMRAVDRGIPLPLALAKNHRSLVYLGNLTGAIIACLQRPEAAGNAYLVSDGEDISTAQLISQMAQALGRPARLWPIPVSFMRLTAGLIGKSAEADRLFGSLQIDSSKIRRDLGWTPTYSLTQGLAETAAWYRRQVQS